MSYRRLLSALFVLAALGGALGLSACNTVGGAGEDLSAAGKAVTDSADRTKQGM